jgi:hypothetical protein
MQVKTLLVAALSFFATTAYACRCAEDTPDGYYCGYCKEITDLARGEKTDAYYCNLKSTRTGRDRCENTGRDRDCEGDEHPRRYCGF